MTMYQARLESFLARCESTIPSPSIQSVKPSWRGLTEKQTVKRKRDRRKWIAETAREWKSFGIGTKIGFTGCESLDANIRSYLGK